MSFCVRFLKDLKQKAGGEEIPDVFVGYGYYFDVIWYLGAM